MKKPFKISKNAKNALFVFLIAFSAFLAFEPLFEHLGQKAAQEFAAAIFGTIFAAVITMVLLSKQTETEEEKNRSDKVFEQKLLLYNEVMNTLQNFFEKDDNEEVKVTQKEILEIEFLLARMMMVGSEKTIIEFKAFYDTVTNNYSPDTGLLHLSPTDKQIVFRFADYCREELGLSEQNIEKNILEDIVVQSDLLYNMQKIEEIESETLETLKDIYGNVVFDLKVALKNIKFMPNGFEAYTDRSQQEESRFIKCLVESDRLYLILQYRHGIKGFENGTIEGEPATVLTSAERHKVLAQFPRIEEAIEESYTKGQHLSRNMRMIAPFNFISKS